MLKSSLLLPLLVVVVVVVVSPITAAKETTAVAVPGVKENEEEPNVADDPIMAKFLELNAAMNRLPPYSNGTMFHMRKYQTVSSRIARYASKAEYMQPIRDKLMELYAELHREFAYESMRNSIDPGVYGIDRNENRQEYEKRIQGGSVI